MDIGTEGSSPTPDASPRTERLPPGIPGRRRHRGRRERRGGCAGPSSGAGQRRGVHQRGPGGPSLRSRVHVGSVVPVLSLNPPYAFALNATHRQTHEIFGTAPGSQVSWASEMLYMSGQHGAPTIDAIGHIGRNLKLHGGVDAVQATSRPDGIGNDLGIDAFPRDLLLSRACCSTWPGWSRAGPPIPCPRASRSPPSTSRTPPGSRRPRGPRGLGPRSAPGWGQYFAKDNARYLAEKSPGPGVDAGRWLVAQGVRLTGADTATYEVRPAVNGKELFPVHMLMIADNGIYLVENANLEDLARRASTLLPRGAAAPHSRGVGIAAPDARAHSAPELMVGPRRGGRRAAGRARPATMTS